MIDFTWEREWRLQTDELIFVPEEVVVLVATHDDAHALVADHNETQDMNVQLYSEIMDEAIAEQYRDYFPWQVAVFDAR